LAIPTFSGTGGKTLLDNAGATISAGVITATGFSGPLTGNVTGNVSGSSGSCTGNAATVTTNANLTGPITSVGNATSIASQTGTGTKFVVDNTPTLITPILGVATATSINKMAITAPATSSTLAVADGKTLTANKTLTLDGTDSTTMTFPTTSATIARTDAAQTFTGTQTFTEIKSANFISTGAVPTVASLTQFDFGVTDFFGASSTSTKTLFTLPASSSCSGMCFVSAESANGTIFSYIFYFYFSAGVFTATQLAAGSSLGVVTASMALSGADVQISLTYTAGIGGAIRYYASGTANCCNY
jgi:hypothetical protein